MGEKDAVLYEAFTKAKSAAWQYRKSGYHYTVKLWFAPKSEDCTILVVGTQISEAVTVDQYLRFLNGRTHLNANKAPLGY